MTATYVAAAAGETLLVEVEVTPGAGTYSSPLSINLDRSLDLSADAEATMIPRSDSQSAPGQTVRVVKSVDWKVSGSGIMNTGDDFTYATMLLSGLARSVRISNTATGGLVLVGQAVITAFSPSSTGIGSKVKASITIEGAGIPTLTAHA